MDNHKSFDWDLSWDKFEQKYQKQTQDIITTKVSEKKKPNNKNFNYEKKNSKKIVELNIKDFYMLVAESAALLSPNPDFKLGVCIAGREKGSVIGVGYNSPIKDTTPSTYFDYDGKYKAQNEISAGLDAVRNSAGSFLFNGAVAYTSDVPDNETIKALAKAGVMQICYKDKEKRIKRSTLELINDFNMASARYDGKELTIIENKN